MKELDSILEQYKNPEKAELLRRFFKTGKGEYGEGDVFLGITVPDQRKIAKQFLDFGFDDIQVLLNSEIHEKRLIGLLILVDKFKDHPTEVYDFYLKNSKKINNWDLVDLSCHKIVGEFLLTRDRSILYKLARSNNLWEKRIAIVSTFAFIRENRFNDCLKISEMLLGDDHDLIHKAVGWMLREVGKKNLAILERFLKKNYKQMPRTMLRYSIEKFPEELRKKYLKGEI